LADGHVVAWIQGKYEIGPRALGNRSLLAAPFAKATLDRLNTIKQREKYRPIAPACLEEDFGPLFGGIGKSPHMLFFQRVQDSRLQAVTHDDGSARTQTVNAIQNERFHSLLRAFKQRTGVGVLCNTSLNFKGKGFINRKSDLLRYVTDNGIDIAVMNDTVFLRRDRLADRVVHSADTNGRAEADLAVLVS
jgi:hydroxymethyl cephem carbamoyltransferase